ncbi:MAG: class I SAM-dependent methyltransferase, partial [Gammaproteobacteria bacterium]
MAIESPSSTTIGTTTTLAMQFKDHFSARSTVYARYRPSYPVALFRWLAESSPGRQCAWDSATGNGQAAIGLAQWFDSVVASDASERQIEDARPHASVTYLVSPSEETTLHDQSVDLVLVAQALHWLDVDAFYREVRRVSRADALIAVCSYSLARIDSRIDSIVDHFYGDVLGDYWPAERRHVDTHYLDLPFPFEQIP